MNRRAVAPLRLRGISTGFLLRLAAAGLLPIATAGASTTLVPYGSVALNYDSSLFKGGERSIGESARSDFSETSILGLSASYLSGDQKLRAKAEGRRVIYDRTSSFDHNEYTVGAGADFTALRALTGSIDYLRQSSLAAYEDLGTTKLTVTTNQNFNNVLKFRMAERWETDLDYLHLESKTPLPNDPAFKLSSDSFNGSVLYLGSERASIGISGGYGSGHYAGGTSNRGNFSSYSIGASGSYRATGISDLSANLGMTKRNDNTSASSPTAFSGKISYDRQLTGKTSMSAALSRSLQSYSVGNSAFVQDSAQLSLNWDASAKIKVGLAASQSYMKLLTTDQTNPQLAGRKDRGRLANLQMKYLALDWLAVVATGGYQIQKSNYSFNDFESVTAALSVEARFE